MSPDPTSDEPAFESGQIVTVFRSWLAPGADAEPDPYGVVADQMMKRAHEAPGFVDAKSFSAPDGERVTVVTFADEASHDAWRRDPRHREVQALGRAKYYGGYRIQVARCLRASAFDGEERREVDRP